MAARLNEIKIIILIAVFGEIAPNSAILIVHGSNHDLNWHFLI